MTLKKQSKQTWCQSRFMWYKQKFKNKKIKTLVAAINPLSANFTKWSNTLKQFVGKLPTNCLSVFDHFVGLALKGLTTIKYWIGWKSIKRRTKKKKGRQETGDNAKDAWWQNISISGTENFNKQAGRLHIWLRIY